MIFDWFKKKQKSCLGIDFGASGIKIIELSRHGKDRVYLSNYCLVQTKQDSKVNVSKMGSEELAALLKHIFEKANIKTKEAVISLSVGETFSTIINLPAMSEEELTKAIPFQAKKYVPIPIEEVVLDWSVVGEFMETKQNSPEAIISEPEAGADEKVIPPQSIKMLQVLIVAVPQEVIRKIAQVAKKIELKVLAVEQEAFSIVRALIGNDQGAYLIADLGQQNVDMIIVDKGAIRLTYTFESDKPFDLASEAVKIVNLFQSRYQRKITKMILAGGGTTQGPWAEAFSKKLGIDVSLGDPFARVAREQKIEWAVKQIAPFMSVAVGGAMREL